MSIVLATDLKPHSEKAEAYAMEYASAFDQPLHIISIITPGQDIDADVLREHAESRLEDMERIGSSQGLDIVKVIEYGLPAERVMNYAEECGASVIIVGTSKKSSLSRVILGSVSERIVKIAGTTVIVVR